MNFAEIYDSKTNTLLDAGLEEYAVLREYSISSKKQFALAMMRYSNATGMKPADLLNEAFEDEDKFKRMQQRRISGRLAAMKAYITDLKPNTQKCTFNTVVHWYKMNDIQVPSMVRTNDKVTGVTENRYIPDVGDIRNMLTNATCSRDTAIILLQLSSGMGNSEVLSIETQEFLDGVDYDTMITTLKPNRGKTQQPYVTFCSPEATKAVLYYLEKYEGKMLFPLTKQGLMAMYHRLSARMEDKPEGQYSKFRSHNLRKFFNSKMLNAGMPRDLVWFFSGRTENETQKAYIDYTDEHLREEYMRFMEAVYVVTEVIEPDKEMIEKLQAENLELREQMVIMQKINQDAVLEIDALKRGSAVIEQKFSNVVDQLAESGLIKIPEWEPDPDTVYTKEDIDHIEKIVGNITPSSRMGPIKLNQKKASHD